MKHSAEWYRGAVAVLGRMVDECDKVFTSDLPHITEGNLEDYLAEYSQQLAAAEARESGEPGTDCLMQILRDGQADRWASTCGSDEGGFQPSEWVLEAEKVLAGEYSGSGFAEQLAAAQAEVERLSTRVDALEDSMNPQDVATVDATLREKAEQLEEARAEVEELREEVTYVRQQLEWIEENGDTYTSSALMDFVRRTVNGLDHTSIIRDAIAARDASIKRLGAIEALEDIAKDSGIDGGKAYFATVVYREFPDRLTTQIGVVEAADIMQRAAQLRQQAEAARLAEGE